MATLVDRPQPNDVLAMSQGDLLANVEYFQEAFNKEHLVTFGQSSGIGTAQGRHTYISFSNQTNVAGPIGRPANRTCVLYGLDTNLYWNPTSTPVHSVLMTNALVEPTVTGKQGFTFLPGGLMMAYGTVDRSAIVPPLAAMGAVAYGNGGFSFNGVAENALSITLSVLYNPIAPPFPGIFVSNGAGVAPTATGFTWNIADTTQAGINAAVAIYWSAIGRKT